MELVAVGNFESSTIIALKTAEYNSEDKKDSASIFSPVLPFKQHLAQ
jgi:hypothetical protein